MTDMNQRSSFIRACDQLSEWVELKGMFIVGQKYIECFPLPFKSLFGPLKQLIRRLGAYKLKKHLAEKGY